MIPIHWTTSHEKPLIDQVGTFIDRKIECALSKIHEEVSSPNPKEYKQGLEPKLDARLRAHHQFLEGAKDPFGFTEKEYDACESWNRLSVRARAAQGAFVEFVKKKNFEMTQVLKKFSTELELIDRFEQVLKKVPSPNLSKGTLFVHDGPTFDEFCYQQQTILGSLTARLTKGPESHAGIITTKPRYPDGKDTTKDVFFSHVMGEYRFEDASEPFLPPYLIAYKVDLTNLVQEKALPLLHDLLGPDYEEKLERLWTKSKSEVAQSIELPDVENGFLHRVTSFLKPTSKFSGFDQSSIESVTSRGKTQMFCSEYARLNLIATSNVFEKKLKKLLSKKAERPGFEQQKQDLQKIPHLIYHLAHEKSRIASSTPAGLVNKYQRDSKKSPDSAKYRKAILVPLDQVDTDTWANWGKLFRLPKSSSME